MKVVCLFVCLCVGITSFAQKGNPSSFMTKGPCSEVINDLKRDLNNDSLAVAYFRENYVIVNNPKAARILKQKKYKEVLSYFSQEENKSIHCCHRLFWNRYISD